MYSICSNMVKTFSLHILYRNVRSRSATSPSRSRDDYVNTAFVDWVQKWPGQVVIGIFNLFWTAEVNEARQKNSEEKSGGRRL